MAVKDALYKKRDSQKPQPVFSAENQRLLNRYWLREYDDRELVDAASMKADLARAVDACGTLSLRAADKKELQAKVNSAFSDQPNKQRRAVSRLNQLLRFAGRDFKLRKAKAVRAEPRFLTWNELEAVLPYLPDRFRVLARTAWVTGCRVGEIFALTPSTLKQKYLLVASQIDDDGNRRSTKTGNERKATILRGQEGRAIVQAWIDLDSQTKSDLRQVKHSTIFKRGCVKAFPTSPTKHCRFHDLRHSYAIDMIGKGVPIGLVAQALGNSVAVCEKHYAGFVLQDEGIETIERYLGTGV